MLQNPVQKRWGDILEKKFIDKGIEFYKCKYNEGYVIDIQKLPEAKGQFLTAEGKYIVPTSDWKQLIKLNPSLAEIVYNNQTPVKRLFKTLENLKKKLQE